MLSYSKRLVTIGPSTFAVILTPLYLVIRSFPGATPHLNSTVAQIQQMALTGLELSLLSHRATSLHEWEYPSYPRQKLVSSWKMKSPKGQLCRLSSQHPKIPGTRKCSPRSRQQRYVMRSDETFTCCHRRC